MGRSAAALLFVVAASTATATPPPDDPPELAISLLDQYGRPVRVEGVPGAVTLIAYADREGAEANRRWAQVLDERYRDHLDGVSRPLLRVVPVAHLEGVPGFVRGFVKRRFRGTDEHGAPVLSIALDWKGEVATELGFTPGIPNLAILRADGSVAAQTAAEADDGAANPILRALDGLLSPPRTPEAGR